MKKRGFTLVETLIYIAILAVMATLVVSVIITMSKTLLQIKENRRVNQAATVALERLVREVREAGDLDVVNSVFDTDPGTLEVDDTRFFLIDATLMIEENSVQLSLTPDNISVDGLVFRNLTSTTSDAVRVEMTVEGQPFYSTIVLRNSY